MKKDSEDVFGVLWGWDLENSGHEVTLNEIFQYLNILRYLS